MKEMKRGDSGVGGIFAVDDWGCRKSKAFFLTHLHADHTKGLSEGWFRGPLYCSDITAALLRLKFPCLDPSLIHVLALSTPTLLSLPNHHLLEVTAIDANHCPGSIMLIFRGPFGCIIHTGDFRWESGSLKLDCMKRCIASAVGGSRVNLLHLDNTFCNPCFSFPTRHVAAHQVVDIIIGHEGFDVLIGVDSLGKEELLIFIAKALQTKIWVWPERLQIMKALNILEFFVTDTMATRIRAVPRYSISHETLGMLNEIKPTIAVLPSGLKSPCFKAASNSSPSDCGTKQNPSQNQGTNLDCCLDDRDGLGLHSSLTPKIGVSLNCKYSEKPTMEKKIFCVSYSLHSCFSELKEFLEFVKPLSVKGIIKSSSVDVSPGLALSSMESTELSTFRTHHDLGTGEIKSNAAQDYLATVVRGTRALKRPEKRQGLKKASRSRLQRAWALMRRRRAGGSFLRSQ